MFYMIDNAFFKSKNIEKKKVSSSFRKSLSFLCYRNFQLSHKKNPFLFLYIEYKDKEKDIYPTHPSHYSLIE
jgi:hypothetical protein